MGIAAVGVIVLHGGTSPWSWPPIKSGLGFTENSSFKTKPKPASSLRQPLTAEVEVNSTPVAKPLPPQADAQRLFSHIKALAFQRHTAAERQQARDYILQALQAAGWSSTLQSFEGGTNIFARRPGTDSEAGSILVAAHYDTVLGSPGADDNASGVATVLEIARLFGSRPTPRTLEIALFDQEEEGALGSYAFTTHKANLTHLQAVIVVEMVGFACHTLGCQRHSQGLPITPPTQQGDFLVIVGDAEHLPLLKAFQQADQSNLPPILPLSVPFRGVMTPDLLRSDHAPFWYQGVGAVMVTDTADFRNPHYHQSSDTPETIDRSFLRGSAQIVANATAVLLAGRKSLATDLSP